MQLPGELAGEEELVIGCLDVCLGARLPSEALVGRRPPTPAQRAYISNVCVAPGARRRGVARALMRGALAAAAAAGARDAYVHVQASNPAALRLYRDRCGFVEEQREAAGKPGQRLLLHCSL
ncbi:hypothetical protein QBZ16_001921 [Prototheca wickerhamii]|uniref:N-acetyltransferase domain-containing protein n=1 Tax=Prototheca wickerhamii TaxID=3111 RepID=A0AAD9INV9_PROWI|nr:hypothetical protein QBZ16_001921 [Prototheca wickerhamii]